MSEAPPAHDPARDPARDPAVAPRTSLAKRLADLVRAHPFIAAILLVCTLGGAAAGPAVFDETWSLARQIAAGAFLGAWVGITITVTKMIG